METSIFLEWRMLINRMPIVPEERRRQGKVYRIYGVFSGWVARNRGIKLFPADDGLSFRYIARD
ncbi:MAG TPA: hypothetical protein VII90_08615 [Anaerolineales bacterium]